MKRQARSMVDIFPVGDRCPGRVMMLVEVQTGGGVEGAQQLSIKVLLSMDRL